MPPSAVALNTKALLAWQRGLRQRRHRALLLITGDEALCRERARSVIQYWQGTGVWLGDQPDMAGGGLDCLAPASATRLLGRELDWLVVDAHSGLSPDTLGAAGGCLVVGGLLLLLAPPRSQWSRFTDPGCSRYCPWPNTAADYAQRFWRHLHRSLQGEAVCEWPEASLEPGWPELSPIEPQQLHTKDQQLAVAAIERVVTGRAGRPLVLIAHRGRGKSAALGMAAGKLLQQGRVRRVVVTSARREAVVSVLKHAAQEWPKAQCRGDGLYTAGSSLSYQPPDAVDDAIDLLLVDEAAALPAVVLQRLLSRHRRIAFASTVHGYEGSGRGFDLRFTRVLQQWAPHWRRQQLLAPIRWAEDDPLEALLFRALLLDAEPASVTDSEVQQPLLFERLQRDELVADEPLLRQLFGLLVAAHYRTAPDDLRELLDAPHYQVWCGRVAEKVVAAALVAKEGGLSAELADEVALGRRRPHGHLLAQGLALHGGLPQAAVQCGARIVRIAVHPDWRRRGIGRQLLQAVATQLHRDGLDWLGSSFALDPEVIGFWRQAGYGFLRVGVRRDAASGERALQVVLPLSQRAQQWLPEVRAGFNTALPLQLADYLNELPVEMVGALLRGSDHPAPQERYQSDCRRFIEGLPLESCLPALKQWALHLLASSTEPLPSLQEALLVRRLVQHWPSSRIASELALQGGSAVEGELRSMVSEWLSSINGRRE